MRLPDTIHVFYSPHEGCWAACVDVLSCPRRLWPYDMQSNPDVWRAATAADVVSAALHWWPAARIKVMTLARMQSHYARQRKPLP